LAEFQTELKEFSEQAQQSLQQSIEDAQVSLNNLPDNLEKSAVESDDAIRQAVLDDLRKTQAQLEEAAKAYEEKAREYEEYAQQANAYEQDMLRQAKETRSQMATDYRQKVEDVQESYRLTSDAINTLAEDTEKANKDTSEFLRKRVEEHI